MTKKRLTQNFTTMLNFDQQAPLHIKSLQNPTEAATGGAL